MANDLTDDQRDQLLQELQNRGKIAAVKLYKEWTGCSLRDAKNFVEGLPPGEAPAADVLGDKLTDQQMDRILDAIHRGNKLEAVKLYKESSDASLMESKVFIERLMSDLGVEDRAGGCASVILLAVVVTYGTWIAVA